MPFLFCLGCALFTLPIPGIQVAPPSHSYMLHAACLPELLPELSEWRRRQGPTGGTVNIKKAP